MSSSSQLPPSVGQTSFSELAIQVLRIAISEPGPLKQKVFTFSIVEVQIKTRTHPKEYSFRSRMLCLLWSVVYTRKSWALERGSFGKVLCHMWWHGETRTIRKATLEKCLA